MRKIITVFLLSTFLLGQSNVLFSWGKKKVVEDQIKKLPIHKKIKDLFNSTTMKKNILKLQINDVTKQIEKLLKEKNVNAVEKLKKSLRALNTEFMKLEKRERKLKNEIISLIKSSKHNINDTNQNKETPLHVATKFGFWEFVNVLLKEGAGVTLKDKWGMNFLHVAAEMGVPMAIDVFIQQTFNAKDNEGKIPLHFSTVRRGNIKVVKILAPSSDSSIKDSDGKTPLDIAKAAGRTDFVEVIEKAKS